MRATRAIRGRVADRLLRLAGLEKTGPAGLRPVFSRAKLKTLDRLAEDEQKLGVALGRAEADVRRDAQRRAEQEREADLVSEWIKCETDA